MVIFDNIHKNFNIISFQYRIFQKLCYFAFNIKYSPFSLLQFKNYLLESDRIFPYNLSQSSKEHIAMGLTKTNYGDLTFKIVFARLLNKHNVKYLLS